jgi:hypothetical protein
MARMSGRTRPCTRREAQVRLRQAEQYVDAADLVLDDGEFSGVAAALAVLAGIAASDAACCARLGEHHRGQDHKAAVALVETVEPGGRILGKDLKRLLDRKDDAHYGLMSVSSSEERDMVEWARRMLEQAKATLEV